MFVVKALAFDGRRSLANGIPFLDLGTRETRERG